MPCSTAACTILMVQLVQNKIIFTANIDLTRFNKIAIQGAPQMAVVKEAI